GKTLVEGIPIRDALLCRATFSSGVRATTISTRAPRTHRSLSTLLLQRFPRLAKPDQRAHLPQAQAGKRRAAPRPCWVHRARAISSSLMQCPSREVKTNGLALMAALHLVHGTVDKDKAALIRAARRRVGVKTWIVPKGVKPGDHLVIYVGKTFFATARVASTAN